MGARQASSERPFFAVSNACLFPYFVNLRDRWRSASRVCQQIKSVCICATVEWDSHRRSKRSIGYPSVPEQLVGVVIANSVGMVLLSASKFSINDFISLTPDEAIGGAKPLETRVLSLTNGSTVANVRKILRSERTATTGPCIPMFRQLLSSHTLPHQ